MPSTIARENLWRARKRCADVSGHIMSEKTRGSTKVTQCNVYGCTTFEDTV